MNDATRSKLVDLAFEAGWTIEAQHKDDGGAVTVRKSPKGVAVRFWASGTATRWDDGIDLTIVKAMTIAEVRKLIESNPVKGFPTAGFWKQG